MIAARGLSARVGGFTLTDVTFEIPRGAYGVVIGPAGSGKTTLLETIAGIIRPLAGELRLAGVDVAGVPPERRDLGLVYQHGYLFPHLSVADNVAYGARDDEVPDNGRNRVHLSTNEACGVRRGEVAGWELT